MYSSRSSWRGRNINMRTLRRPAGKVARRSSRPNAGNEPGLQTPHPRRQAFGVVAETIDGVGIKVDFGAPRQMRAFFLQLVGDVAAQVAGAGAAPLLHAAHRHADLVGGDVADETRQLFFPVDVDGAQRITVSGMPV